MAARDLLLDRVAEVMQARQARRLERVQTLWSGYGEIVRVALDGGIAPTAIVKRVTPPSHARGTASDLRKRRSYGVEIAFYRDVAPRCDDRCRVARLYGHRSDGDDHWLVLEDLDAAGFDERHDPADREQLAACLGWLAAFHARFIGASIDGLWPEGTYWHLATRGPELALAGPRWQRIADELDSKLRATAFPTLLHGDPKEANFLFARAPAGASGTGYRVAAVDFQYAGAGCAMKDVAYLLHGHRDEATHLATYFERLRVELAASRDADADADADAIEADWRALYPIAKLDFERFLAGWRG